MKINSFKFSIAIFCTILTFFHSNGQNSNVPNISIHQNPNHIRQCYQSVLEEEIRSKDPQAFDQRKAQEEKKIQDWIDNYYRQWKASRAVITIPCVVQIWDNTTNVPDVAVYEQIQTLNEDFRRTNADAGTEPAVFQAVAADSEIEFCLAVRDPNGNPTNGIIRKPVGGSPPQSGGSDLWDPSQYLNIYVYNIGGGTLGFTYTPSTSVNQAVHIDSDYFGKTGASAPFNLGRTATHEVGHWLNLEHVWGPGGGGCSQDDFVNDTPLQNASNGGCPSHPSPSCSNGGDQFMNYMDYVNDACMTMFSEGQKSRMISAINTYRSSLLTSPACTPFSNDDAAISNISSPSGTYCGTSFDPVVTLINNGGADLTSVTINYDVDGGTNQTYSWTGSLATGETEVITLPTVTTTSGSHTFNASTSLPNGNADEVPSNDANSSTFSIVVGGTQVNLDLFLDCFGDEIDWEITDASSNVIDNGSGYTNNASGQQINESYCLTSGCYDFTINDSYGDGLAGAGASGCSINGDYTITDGSGNVLVQMATANFGNQATHNFCVPVSSNADDAGVTSINSPTGSYCGTTIDPVVVIQNFGTNTLTTVTINYDIDGGANQTYNWTGTLTQGQTATVSLPTMAVSGGNHTFNASTSSPNGTTDEDTSNDGTSGAFTITNGSMVDLFIHTDCWGQETYWEIVDGTSNTLYSGGNSVVPPGGQQIAQNSDPGAYADDIDINESFCLADGCYDFIIYDDYGDGMAGNGISTCLVDGDYNITDNNNNVLVQMTQADFGNSATHNFCLGAPNCSITAATLSNVSCNGGTDGSGEVIATGGTSNYNYNWSNGANTSSVSNFTAGVHTVTVTDTGSCLETESITITEPSALLISSTTTSVTCNGLSDGTIDLTVSNGTTSYSYNWSNGATTEDISNLAAGAYSVTVTDGNNCEAVESNIGITEPNEINITISSTSELCNSNNGTANASAMGGTGAYSYSWSTGANTASINSLNAGIYSVTVTDINGCINSESVTIENIDGPNVTLTSTDAVCNNGGSATVTASGGETPYNYNWSNGGNSSTISNLSSNTYSVTVSDANNCATVQSISIGNINNTISISFSTTNETCNNANGIISTSVSGGNAPYGYSWNNSETTSSISGLSAGSFTVTVTDNNGCSNSNTTSISNSPSTVTATINSTTDFCSNNVGSATANPSGGTSPYTFTWSNGGNSATQTGLSAGGYTVTVSDFVNCLFIGSVTVDSSTPTTTVNTTVSDASCSSSNGAINAESSNGASPYTYAWSNGESSNTATGLTAGTYFLTVTDNNNCVTTISETVNDLSGMTITSSSNDETCSTSNGTAGVTVTGGSTPYTYLWNNSETTSNITGIAAGNYSVTITDNSTCKAFASEVINNVIQTVSISGIDAHCGQTDGSASSSVSGGQSPYSYLWSTGANTSSISNIAAATYALTVSDNNSCEVTSTVTINDIAGPTVTINATNESCNASNGSLSAMPSGGSGPYTYLWSDASTTQTINNLSASCYDLTLTDNANCVVVDNACISNINGPSITITTSQATCAGGDGTATANTSGGTTPYTYLWNDADSQSSITATGLDEGTYTVTVTDAGGCSTSSSETVTSSSSKKYTVEITTPNCNGPNVTWDITDENLNIIASGSMGRGQTRTWDICDCGETFTLNAPQGTTGNPSARCPNNIAPQNASVYDENGVLIGSVDTDGETISLIGYSGCSYTCPTINVSVTSTPITCAGDDDATASATTNDGNAPYSYIWSNSTTAQTATNLDANSYGVTITDVNGCEGSESVTINPVTNLSLTIVNTSVTCNNGNDGTATALTSGGVTPYTYIWSNGAINTVASDLTAGNYTVTATDDHGCTIDGNTTVIEPAAMVASTNSTSATCGSNSGSASITVTAGNSPYNYTWSSGGNASTESNLAPGNYTVSVVDNKGCQLIESIAVGNQDNNITVTDVITNATCNLPNGSVTVTAVGGGTPYSYNWSSGGVTNTETGLTPGTYTVSVMDNFGCTEVHVSNVGNNSGQSISVTTSNSTCGNSNGSASVVVSGGSAPYSYNWSTGGTSDSENSIIAGNHSVSVTDATGCLETAPFVINNIAGPTASISTTNATCGSANGEAAAIVSGGTTGYNYFWSTGETTSTISGLSAGNIFLTVTDANNCASNASSYISNEFPTIVSVTSTNETCSNNNGSASIEVTGGTSPYTYNWSSGGNGATENNLSAGNYVVTVNDAVNCIVFESFTITDAPGPVLSTSITNAACGQANGSATVLITSGGTTPFTYEWSNGGTSQTEKFLAANSYFVTVTDANGCSESIQANVNNVSGPTASITTTKSSCIANTGSATVNASGGTTPYVYSWSSGGGAQTEGSLAPGNYTVTVTDMNNCKATQVAVVEQHEAPTVSITTTDENCGNSDGSAAVSISGGNPGYNYNWSTGGNTSSESGLASGSYSLTISDTQGCSVQQQFTITEQNGPSVVLSSTDATCGSSNGSVSSSITGGTTPYSFIWSNGATTSNITGLNVGTYTLTLSDQNGCFATNSQFVSNDIPTINITTTDATCDLANGSATIDASAGQSPFSYIWDDGNTNDTRNDLAEGIHLVTITDGNSCISQESVTINSGGSSITATTNYTDEHCSSSDGSITITVVGGTPNYTYSWSSGGSGAISNNLSAGNYSITISDANSCTAQVAVKISHIDGPIIVAASNDATCNLPNGSISTTVNSGESPYIYSWSNSGNGSNQINLYAGNYTVTVTDNNGCTATTSATINDNGVPAITITSSDASCGNNDGSATATVSNGTPGYTYNWSNGGNTPSITGINAGTYTLSVSDANNCMATSTVGISNSGGPTLSSNTTNETCNGNNGAIDLIISGGTSPFTFDWSNGATTEDLTNIAAGSYSITVTDNNNCKALLSNTIQNLSGPAINVTATDASCGQNNGAIGVVINGGSSPFNIDWSNGSSSSSQTNVSAGNYTVTVTDNSGCSATASGFVNNDVPTITTNSSDAHCGKNDGSALVSVSGGTIPYSYLWSHGGTSSIESNLYSGIYTVTVSDASGCIKQESITVNEIDGPTTSSYTTEASCNTANGTGSIVASGGQPPYSYLWSSGGTGQTETGLSAGNYTVIVSDANNCNVTETVIITNAGAAVLSITATEANCGQNDASATVIISGGQPPFSIQWSSGATSATATNLGGGSYTATVIDDNTCVTVASISIADNPSPTVTLSSINESCDLANGMIATSTTGNVTGYSWSNGATSGTVSGLSAGTYQVTVMNAAGCTGFAVTTLTNTPSPQLTVTNTHAVCGDTVGIATTAVSGGSTPYSYLWSNGNTLSYDSLLVSGVHAVTVIDANSCTDVVSLTVTSATLPSVTLTGNNAICGGANGNATAQVSGTTSPYSYSWSNGTTTSVVNNLTEGNYYVTVTDIFACVVVDSIELNNLQPIVSSTVTPEACGNGNGSIALAVSSGQPPYSVNWSNGASGSVISNLTVGNYSYTVTDVNACTATGTLNIINQQGPTVFLETADAICGEDNGSIEAIATGGFTPYSYTWSNGANTSMISGLKADLYSLFITDAQNCIVSAGTEIEQDGAPEIDIIVTNASCGENNGKLSADVKEGKAPYLYEWNNGAVTAKLTGLEEGTYTLTVTDYNDCKVSETATIIRSDEVCLSIPTGFTPNGDAYNEFWVIDGVEYYQDITVEVYNRWGSLLFSSNGYNEPWDGTHNGNELPSAVYYYIVTIPSYEFSQTGTITIRR